MQKISFVIMAQFTNRTSSANVVLKDDEFFELQEFIVQVSGIFFPNSKRYLIESRLKRRVEQLGLSSFREYIDFLRFSPYRGKELDILFKLITINETYFFRDELQLKVIEESILPELISSKPKNGFRSLRIWSAGCSTGEEPYTIAMIFLEKIRPRFPDVVVEIVGTDINGAVLEVARAGVYGSYSVRFVPENYLIKYFENKGDEFYLRDEVKRLVRFERVNLVDKFQMLGMRGFDLVLLRNVLIYLEEGARREVVSLIYDSLNRGGYLIVGYSESLRNVTKAFKVVYFEKVVAYKKE